MMLRNRKLLLVYAEAALLLHCVAFVQSQGYWRECYDGSYGYLNFNRDAFTLDDLALSQIYEGPVEICVNGEYATVCDIGWDKADAQTLCRDQFGYNYEGEPLYSLGYPRNNYINQTFHCSEYDYYLGRCYMTMSIDQECFNGSHVAGVRCTERCYDGEVRLRNQLSEYTDHGLPSYSAEVIVCINGSFHQICDVGWDDIDAQVVCNHYYGYYHNQLIGEVYQSYPLIPNSRYVVENVSCSGDEYSFDQCNFSPSTSPECLSGGNHSAALVCRQTCTEGRVRLVDRNYDYYQYNVVSGTVQVCINGQYVYICSNDWDDREANVICRSMGYHPPYYENTASNTTRYYESIPIYHDSMCNGTELNFNECQFPISDSNSTCSSIATVKCAQVISRCYSEGRFRLANSSTTYTEYGSLSMTEGRIEVCHNNSYTSLCYQYWDPVDAQVFCQYHAQRHFYYNAPMEVVGKPTPPSQYGYSRAGVLPYDIMCNGTEYSTEQCVVDRSHSSSPFCEDPTTSAAGVQCYFEYEIISPPSCINFTVRTTNEEYVYTYSDFYFEGTVEVCLGGSYYSICDEGWDDTEAQLVCSLLGYDSRYYRGTALKGRTSTVPIIVENVICFGNETDPSQCSYTSPPITPRCLINSNAAGIRCSQVRTQCYDEGDIMMLNPVYDGYLNIYTGGDTNVTGKMGVCHNGVYDSVCDANWDDVDATVFCQTYGQHIGTALHGLPAGLDPVSLEDVHCTGNETSIYYCPTSPIGEISENSICLQPNHTAGTTCTTTGCIEGFVRLVDGPAFYEGRVEICRNKQWLSVCDVGVDTSYAHYICETRHHYGGNVSLVKGGAYGPGEGQQLSTCNSGSSYYYYVYHVPVEECTSSPDVRKYCTRDRDVGVHCQPGQVTMAMTATGTSTLGSTSFVLECSAHQQPWEARMDTNTDQLYKNGSPIPAEGSLIVEVVEDYYNSDPYISAYNYTSKLTFSQPLTVSDRGEYTCNVSLLLTYPDDSTYLLTNTTSYSLIIEVPSPSVSIEINGSQIVGSHIEVNCFAELSDRDLAPYITIDYLDNSFTNLQSLLEANRQEEIQLLPIRRYNETHFVRTVIIDQLEQEDQNVYYCVANYSASHLLSYATMQPKFLQVFANEDQSDLQTLHGLLPFGNAHDDSVVPTVDDGYSQEITLNTSFAIFGSRKHRIYVNTNGLLSFGGPFTRTSSFGLPISSVLSPHIIAPFWDDIDITKGGTIYFRQDTNSSLAEQLKQEISIQYPELGTFCPLLVFVATWEEVAAFSSDYTDQVNTFQATLASDGIKTFIRFSYGDIQWGGSETQIGASAGDGLNFITHPVSLSPLVRFLDDSTFTYRVDLPIVPPARECSVEGELLNYFNSSFVDYLRHYEGAFEICIGGLYGSVCDIGWNQAAAQAVCHSQFGEGYIGVPIYSLGYPQKRYTAQNFVCSDSAPSLVNCSSYDTSDSVSSMCYVGPHVAGVRCTETPPPPPGVQGLCSLIVWSRPALSCGRINRYDVKLYHPQSPQQYTIRQVGANGTFYIITDEDRRAGYNWQSYFQVRVVYNGSPGEWSEAISLGCDDKTVPEEPGVYFALNGNEYGNNSAVPLRDIGEGEGALYCKTDKVDCCRTPPNRYGEFYYPNGAIVSIKRLQHGFYRNRGDQFVRLNRREGIVSPRGKYMCEIPNANGATVKIYITLTE